MTRVLLCVSVLLATPLMLSGEQVIPLFTEDFENGLDAWTFEQKEFIDAEPDQMSIFPEVAPDIYGPQSDPYGVWGNSQCVGHSNITWDGTSDHWIQRQWPEELAPGLYTVTLEYDFYVYADVNHLAGGPWDVGNRVYLLTDEDYDFPCFDFDNHNTPPDESPGFNIDTWPGYENYLGCDGTNFCVETAPADYPEATVTISGSGELDCTSNDDCNNMSNRGDESEWPFNGVWRRVSWTMEMTTATGNLELRLLMHEKGGGPETVAWDDVHLLIKDESDQTVLDYTEDFEGENPLSDWTQMVSCREPVSNNDTPRLFVADDPLLYDNINNPGSQSAGYSDDNEFQDKTGFAYMKHLLPGALEPGVTVPKLRMEFDWYAYGPEGGDPWHVGTYVYILTDNRYNMPGNDEFYNGDYKVSRWPGAEPDGEAFDWTYNGTWRHWTWELENFTSQTGDLDIRLLQRQKYAGDPQASAWDNFVLAIVLPCNAVRFDVDGDGDVDQDDFGHFQACVTGTDDPSGAFDAQACECVDMDSDADVDTMDFAAFEACASGPDIPADEACDDPPASSG